MPLEVETFRCFRETSPPSHYFSKIAHLEAP